VLGYQKNSKLSGIQVIEAGQLVDYNNNNKKLNFG
jgi:hypothetical protein